MSSVKSDTDLKVFIASGCFKNLTPFHFLESEKELISVRNQLDMKEKMLQSEESLRKKLELQMNKLTNNRIYDR